MTAAKDHTNKIYGIFKVIKDLGMFLPNNGSANSKKFRKVIVECKNCKNIYEGNYQSFKSGHRKCKCQLRPKFTLVRKRIYSIHYQMILRCYDKDNISYKYYGARGITICDEWKDSYESFFEWAIKNGYDQWLTIDRIDNNKGYYPENCRWITPTENSTNKRNVISIDKVIEIKKLLLLGHTHNEIADKVKTSCHRVSNISKGLSWSNIKYGKNE